MTGDKSVIEDFYFDFIAADRLRDYEDVEHTTEQGKMT